MEEQVKKSWFRRNWLWFVPSMGCLTIIVLFFLGIGALVFGVFNMMSEATPTKYAIEKAMENRIVIQKLGKGIEQDGIISGSITFSNNGGEADLKIPINGSKGNAIIRVVAEKFDDVWTYKKLYVIIKVTNEKINLLKKSLEGI
ncbi:MAG: hypothetical protein JKY02_02860 [Flavobacteriaceae bacterium]|nr:hypothetical protein [Flavobacteriaceae bacterium]